MIRDLVPQDRRLNIHPGEWYFGDEYEILYTVLGSCVALSVWHPTLKLGGLCHYLLARQPGNINEAELARVGGAGRYASSVLQLLKKAMQRYAAVNEYQLGLFGGCDAFAYSTIGQQNISYAQEWLQDHHLTLTRSDLGGTSSRTLALTISSGAIELKRYVVQIDDLPVNHP
jgi:chemotaxis protein CheD